MTTLVSGSATGIGRRVVAALSDAHGDDITALPRPGATDSDSVARVDEAVRSGARTLVHLAAGDHDALARRRANAVRVTEEALAIADRAGVDHVVLLSSAMAYGAWPSNPIPLTEGSPLKPNRTFRFALQLAQVEQITEAWRTEATGRSVTVLRPVLSLASDGTASLVRALAAGMGLELDDEDAPAQFLHLDDLTSAVTLAHEHRLDGVYNVAPDGWITGETLRALSGNPPRVRLPARVAVTGSAWRWRFQRGPLPAGLRPYTRYPWLVANDRLRAEGWAPQATNEQAYVEGTEAKWWTMLTPQRKQELALGAMGTAITGAAAGAVVSVRAARRRRANR
jgi:nucleoside-diphosphate-sugar epimerase